MSKYCKSFQITFSPDNEHENSLRAVEHCKKLVEKAQDWCWVTENGENGNHYHIHAIVVYKGPRRKTDVKRTFMKCVDMIMEGETDEDRIKYINAKALWVQNAFNYAVPIVEYYTKDDTREFKMSPGIDIEKLKDQVSLLSEITEQRAKRRITLSNFLPIYRHYVAKNKTTVYSNTKPWTYELLVRELDKEYDVSSMIPHANYIKYAEIIAFEEGSLQGWLQPAYNKHFKD